MTCGLGRMSLASRLLIPGVAVGLLMLGSCGQQPVRSVGGVSMTAVIRPMPAELVIDVQVRNQGQAPMLLTDRMLRPGDQKQVGGAYVLPGDDDQVEVSHRLLPLPEGVAFAAPPVIGATTLAPGAERRWTLQLSLPLAPNGLGPDEQPLPDPVEAVVYCLGVLPELPGLGPDPVLEHGSRVAERQTLLCSDPIPLDNQGR